MALTLSFWAAAQLILQENKEGRLLIAAKNEFGVNNILAVVFRVNFVSV